MIRLGRSWARISHGILLRPSALAVTYDARAAQVDPGTGCCRNHSSSSFSGTGVTLRHACKRLTSPAALRSSVAFIPQKRFLSISAVGSNGTRPSVGGVSPPVASPPVGGADAQAASDATASTVAETAKQALPVIDIAPVVGELGWWPSELAMRAIDGLATTTGWPYWMSIAAITIGLRTMLFPLGLLTQRNSARMSVMRPEMDELRAAMEADNRSTEQRKAERFRGELRALFKKHECSIGRTFIFPAVQIPLMVTFFAGLRSMTEYFPGYATGGALWFPDLGAPDPLLVLPLFASGTLLLMSEVGADGMAAGATSTRMRLAMRGIAVLMVPMTMNFSSGVFIYFATSNMFSLAQTILLRVPRIKKALNLPTVPPAPEPQDADITWVDVLAARNPPKLYRKMRQVRAAEALLEKPGDVGGGVSGSAIRPGAPLPPPPPLTTQHGGVDKANNARGINEAAQSHVVLHTSPPKKQGVESKKTGRGGKKKKKKQGRHSG